MASPSARFTEGLTKNSIARTRTKIGLEKLEMDKELNQTILERELSIRWECVDQQDLLAWEEHVCLDQVERGPR